MVQINIVVREIGKLKPDFSLDFELPEVPAVGSYISILRPDTPEPYGEDLVVRKVWWRIKHPEIKGLDDLAPAKIGSFHEIFVECNQAAGRIPVKTGYRYWTVQKSAASRSKNSKSPVSAFLKVNSTKNMIWSVQTTYQIASPALSRLLLVTRIRLRRPSRLGPLCAFSRRSSADRLIRADFRRFVSAPAEAATCRAPFGPPITPPDHCRQGRKRRMGPETAQEPRRKFDSHVEALSADTVAVMTASPGQTEISSR